MPETEVHEQHPTMNTEQAAKITARIYEIFKEMDLSPADGVTALAYAAAVTILDKYGPETFDINANEFMRMLKDIGAMFESAREGDGPTSSTVQ